MEVTPPPLLTKGLISGTYFVKPFILKNSNVPFDNIQFKDYTVTFKDQNNTNLTIKLDYKINYLNAPVSNETGTGIESYIVGNNCNFSVFASIESNINGVKAKLINIISGSLSPNGIENLHFSNFMVDNLGNPQNLYISNGQGRVIYDSDGFSELVGTPTTWYTAIPDCPCTLRDVRRLKKTICPSGEWSITDIFDYYTLPKFHYGASYEARWTPNNGTKAGQQCTYDANENLITDGLAAGSVDSIAPGITSIGSYEHYNADVQSWKIIECWRYMQIRPSNNGLSCTINVVSGINNMINGVDNLKKMIGDMTCEEATLLIKSAKETAPPTIDVDLRNYIIGLSVSLTEQQCKKRLQEWKTNVSVSSELFSVLTTAINNL